MDDVMERDCNWHRKPPTCGENGTIHGIDGIQETLESLKVNVAQLERRRHELMTEKESREGRVVELQGRLDCLTRQVSKDAESINRLKAKKEKTESELVTTYIQQADSSRSCETDERTRIENDEFKHINRELNVRVTLLQVERDGLSRKCKNWKSDLEAELQALSRQRREAQEGRARIIEEERERQRMEKKAKGEQETEVLKARIQELHNEKVKLQLQVRANEIAQDQQNLEVNMDAEVEDGKGRRTHPSDMITCKFCGQQGTQNHQTKCGWKKRHPDGESCQYCGQTFHYQWSLYRHHRKGDCPKHPTIPFRKTDDSSAAAPEGDTVSF